MTLTLTFARGKPAFDWFVLLQQVLQNGNYVQADGGSLGEVSLVHNSVLLRVTSATNDLTLSGGSLTGGTITSVTLLSGTTVILTGTFEQVAAAATLQSLKGNVATESAMIAGLDALLGPDATLGNGSPEDDLFAGGPAADTLNGGAGDDDLRAGPGNDLLNGGDGDDFLSGSSGNDTINGDAGNDYLGGGEGDDLLNGGLGDDFYEGFRGVDTYNGTKNEDDWDKVSYEREDGGKGIVAIYKGKGKIEVTDTFGNKEKGTGIDEIKGSQYADKITGSSEDDVTEGMGGADTFSMGAGQDKVEYMHEAEDAGTTKGIIANLSAKSIKADIGFGSKTVKAGHVLDSFGKMDTVSSVEEITGTMFKDHLFGSNGSDWFHGEEGNDRLIGNGGEDFFDGGDGKDSIEGGSGDDHMQGDEGKDLFTGGSGEDDFNFRFMGKQNADTITDFKSGEDEIWLWDDVFGLGSGKLLKNKQFLSGNGADEATKAVHRVIYDTHNGKLYFDHDGKGGDAAVLVAILKGGVELHSSDIQLG